MQALWTYLAEHNALPPFMPSKIKASDLEARKQEVVDNAYELVIKSELAVRLESTFLSKQQIRALLDQENPLAYIYERWENDHAAIGDLLCDTIYTAGNDAHRERLTKSKQQRKEKTR